ncbi:MAG TPA: glycosyltransferase family 39 protein [Acidimicrobiia bacterium]|jgi:4-amino-4-deoxy-L-arabinose transferase-like glycosyltransferase
MAVLTRVRGFLGALLLITGVALGIRLGYAVAVDPQVPELSDASAYHLLANDLADGKGYVRPFDLAAFGLTHPTAEYPPLFPAALSVASLAGGRSVGSQRILTCIIGAGTVFLVGLLGRRVRGDAVGIVAAALAAVYPMLFIADGVLMSEGLFALLVTAALLLAYRAVDRPTPWRFAALGAVLGLAALTRTEGLLLALVLVVPLAIRLHQVPTGRRALLGVVALGATVIVIAPWTIRNAVQLDAFVPISNNVGSALDGANCGPVYSGSDIGLWRSTFAATNGTSTECFEGFDVRAPGFNEATAAAVHRDDGLSYAAHHADRLPVVAAARVLRTFGAFHVSQELNVESFEGRPHAWLVAGFVGYWLLVPFAIVGVVLLLLARALLWPLVAPFAAVAIGTVLTYGNQRFRIGAEPPLVILAAVAFVAIAARLRRTPAPQPSPEPAPELVG